jgi:hypothetical protein
MSALGALSTLGCLRRRGVSTGTGGIRSTVATVGCGLSPAAVVTVCLFMYAACAETGALTPDVDVWSQWRHHFEDGMCMQQWDVLLGCMSGLRVRRRSDPDHAIIGIMQRALEHAYVRTGHFNFTDCSPQPW